MHALYEQRGIFVSAKLSGLTSQYLAALEYKDYRWLWLAALGSASMLVSLLVTTLRNVYVGGAAAPAATA